MRSADERFDAKWRQQDDGCHIWTGALDSSGYGLFWLNGGARKAHRVSYERRYGPMPDGLVTDHLCRNRRCVNPAHLEAVTSHENTMRSPVAVAAIHARKTHCANGHPITAPGQFYVTRRGARLCRLCQNARTRRYRAGLRLKESS